MLTIQPKITQYSQQRNNVSFKSREDGGIPDDSFYKEKQAYYKDQIREFDTLIEDEYTPNAFKKVLKGFRVVSEGLLEGCAVAWGASKGAKVIKSAAVKGASHKFTKKAIDVLKPIAEGFRTTGSKIIKALGEKAADFKTSKFATGIAEKFSKIVDNMNKIVWFNNEFSRCFEEEAVYGSSIEVITKLSFDKLIGKEGYEIIGYARARNAKGNGKKQSERPDRER